MPKIKASKPLLLALSAVALLSACDDKAGGKTNWLDWFKHKDGKRVAASADSSEYARETQAGNYLAGQFAQYRQDWKAANGYLDKAISLDPENIELQQRAMVLAMQAGDATRAVALSRKVLEEDNKNLLALLFVGVDQMAQQQYDSAVRTFTKMPENGIADFIRPILIAWAQAPEKKVDLPALVANGPLHAYHALLIADYMGKVNDPDRYFVNVVTGGISDKHILEMMADVFARQGKTDLAKKLYDTLLAQSDGTAALSSRYRIIQEKRDNAGKSGERIQTPAQGAAEAFYNMARILFQEQSEDSALVFTRLSQFLDPSKEDVKLLLANMMIRAGHIDDAIAFYKSVKPGSPGYPEAQRSAAELLEQQDKIDESIAYLEECYNRDHDVAYLVQIGDVYRRTDKFPEAIKAYDRAVDALGGKVSEDYWNILYARGMSYERAGNIVKAEEDLEAALQFKPEHPYLLNYLGYSWADQAKKLPQAKELIEKAANLKPDDGYIIDSLGWVYFKMGQYVDAVSELEKAVELVPYDPTINDHLGDAFWKVGRKNEARFQWQRALNHSDDEKQKAALEQKLAEGLTDRPVETVKEAKGLPPAEKANTVKQ